MRTWSPRLSLPCGSIGIIRTPSLAGSREGQSNWLLRLIPWVQQVVAKALVGTPSLPHTQLICPWKHPTGTLKLRRRPRLRARRNSHLGLFGSHSTHLDSIWPSQVCSLNTAPTPAPALHRRATEGHGIPALPFPGLILSPARSAGLAD